MVITSRFGLLRRAVVAPRGAGPWATVLRESTTTAIIRLTVSRFAVSRIRLAMGVSKEGHFGGESNTQESRRFISKTNAIRQSVFQLAARRV